MTFSFVCVYVVKVNTGFAAALITIFVSSIFEGQLERFGIVINFNATMKPPPPPPKLPPPPKVPHFQRSARPRGPGPPPGPPRKVDGKLKRASKVDGEGLGGKSESSVKPWQDAVTALGVFLAPYLNRALLLSRL